MLAILLPLAAATAAAPPTVVSTPRAPVVVDEDGTAAATPARVQVDVTLRGPDGVLWSGPLWVGARGQTSWRLNVSEPNDAACGPGGGYYGDATELSIQLQPVNGSLDSGQLSVTARWSRRLDESCGGIRAVEVRDAVRLPDTRPATLRGDGGFVIELRRR